MCLLVGVEALVGWLLDHADAQVTDLSDADTGSEECSDEEVVEDVDDVAYAVVSASCVVAPLPVSTCPMLWVSCMLFHGASLQFSCACSEPAKC